MMLSSDTWTLNINQRSVVSTRLSEKHLLNTPALYVSAKLAVSLYLEQSIPHLRHTYMGSGLSAPLGSSLQPAFPPTHRICSLCSSLASKVLSCAHYIYPLTLGTQPVTLAPSISGNSLSSTVQPCGQGMVPPRTLLNHCCPCSHSRIYPYISA